ncbi:hypothetical protein SAMN05414139_10239 [Burkholderia sp. D7]|nr:hypothetical protein SAMN05414139_10239 [Burkholderia sp. D7]
MRACPFFWSRLEETVSIVYVACVLLLAESPVTRIGGIWLAQGR